MNRRKTVIIVIVASICIFTIGTAFYSNNNTSNNNTPTSTPQPEIKVKITSFNLTGYNNPVGVVWNSAFVLNYLNNGTNDVDNVTITFNTNSTYKLNREIEVFNSTAPHYYIESTKIGESYSLGAIKAGETRELYGDICNSLDDSAKIRGFSFVAILRYNDTILDQAMVIIP